MSKLRETQKRLRGNARLHIDHEPTDSGSDRGEETPPCVDAWAKPIAFPWPGGWEEVAVAPNTDGVLRCMALDDEVERRDKGKGIVISRARRTLRVSERYVRLDEIRRRDNELG